MTLVDQSLSKIKVSTSNKKAAGGPKNSSEDFDSAMESLARPVRTRKSLDRSRSYRDPSRRSKELRLIPAYEIVGREVVYSTCMLLSLSSKPQPWQVTLSSTFIFSLFTLRHAVHCVTLLDEVG